MKILITGASGFIGSHLVEHALAEGHEVWAAVRATTNRKYLQDPRIRFIQLDMADLARVTAQLQAHHDEHGAFDGVIHAAGVTKGRGLEAFFVPNADSTYNLARALLDTHTLRGRFVFMSSLSALGPAHEHDNLPLQDIDFPKGNTIYGNSKLKAESDLRGIEGLDFVILRPTGVYGPRERDYYLMAQSIQRHVDYGVGLLRKHVLTFIYVDDLVQAAFLALTKGPSGRIYHLSDGHDYSSRDFSRLLQKELGVKFVFRFVAPVWVLFLVCWAADLWAKHRGTLSTLNPDKFNIMRQRNWRCDIGPACHYLGYEPQWPLERGVKATVAWYKENGWL